MEHGKHGIHGQHIYIYKRSGNNKIFYFFCFMTIITWLGYFSALRIDIETKVISYTYIILFAISVHINDLMSCKICSLS